MATGQHSNSVETLLGDDAMVYRRQEARMFDSWVTKDSLGVFLWTKKPELDEETGVFVGEEASRLDGKDFESWKSPRMVRYKNLIDGVKGDVL